MSHVNIGVVGATGLVGNAMREINGVKNVRLSTLMMG